MSKVHAHSKPGFPPDTWEALSTHLDHVGIASGANAASFGFAAMGETAGRLHDIGKCSAVFRAYLSATGDAARGPDHSTAGAIEARKLYPGPIGRMLAFIIAGHHAGLADGVALEGRLGKTLMPYDGWELHTGRLALPSEVRLTQSIRLSAHRGFSHSFLIRMVFSAMVDADFIATEEFYGPVERGGFTPLAELRDRLRAFMGKMAAEAVPTPLNRLRADILDHAVAKAELPPGLFTLTVPTGGGKTLASLSFALEHAARHGLRRVVFVIPHTSIIEQTSDVYRSALGRVPERPNRDDVLEHHATFDWEMAGHVAFEDGRGGDAVDRLRRAAENWAAPVVVTTAVQFFESLFAKSTSRCRKLHNLAKSVIVLDEAQTIPLHLLRPCLAALDELARNYGTSVVFCTATQPALRMQDGFDPTKTKVYVSSALDIPDERELAPDPRNLYARLKRVEVERLPEPVEDATIAAHFSAQPRMLCIVNTRRHAQELFGLIHDLPGAVHLSTYMCPAHRRIVLAGARERLAYGEPVRIVSTSLIEAGVDIDLPEVWRAAAGLESIAQAAGRCNREGKLHGLGRVVVFEAAGREPPCEVKLAWKAAREVLRGGADPLGLDGIRKYFGLLYWQKGSAELDAAKLENSTYSILEAIAEREKTTAFPFAAIARAFRMIDDVMEPVIVPWSAGPGDGQAKEILDRVAGMDRPLGPDLRRLQQYVVSIPKRARDAWLGLGVLRPVHRALGEALLRFEGLEHYDPATGVRVGEMLERSAESAAPFAKS